MARIIHADALEGLAQLEDESVQCVLTSPPYWQLRDYKVEGQLGLERTPQEYVERLVGVFREVRRVLRRDGAVWLNVGDTWARSGSAPPRSDHSRDRYLGTKGEQAGAAAFAAPSRRIPQGLKKKKDLIGIPWRLAFALQDDGWWLRSAVVWRKTNPTPESVKDRPSKSYEYVFLLSRSRRYFYDVRAALVPYKEVRRPSRHGKSMMHAQASLRPRGNLGGDDTNRFYGNGGRNLRDVWTFATESYRGAHFATMPVRLAKRCIRLATSEGGCCAECGAPRRRLMAKWHCGDEPAVEVQDVGWGSTCLCAAGPAPCVVADPFAGAATTLVAAQELGRDSVGIELKAEYVKLGRRRLEEARRDGDG